MADRPPPFISSTTPHERVHAKGWRITAFWSVVGIVTVAALVSVGGESRARHAPSAAPEMNLAAPQPVTFIPYTGEPDFNDRFVPEKRNAKAEALPEQF